MTTELLFIAVLLYAVIYQIMPNKVKPHFLMGSTLLFFLVTGRQALVFFVLAGLISWGTALAVSGIQEKAKVTGRTLEREERKKIKKKSEKRCKGILTLALLIQVFLFIVLKVNPGLPSAILSLLFRRTVALPRLFVPFGISFYTFMFISYMLDAYAGKCKAERNPLRVLAFAGFPTALLQGPIGRYGDLNPQLRKTQRGGIDDICRGLLLMLLGLFKKKVIADRAAPFVNSIFGQYEQFGGAMSLLAILCYSAQQYCDFSGGIDIVLGGANIMGIHLAENFRQPYFSAGLAEFWRRWHITLGTWMRDYVFYPLALSKPITWLSACFKRQGRATFLSKALPAVIGNLMVFLLVGLWHGVNGHYVAWGLYNGIIIALSTLLEPVNKRITDRWKWTNSKSFHLFRIIRTFIIVNIGWFFDRADTVSQALNMLRGLFSFRPEQVSLGLLAQNGMDAGNLVILLSANGILFVLSLVWERGYDLYERIMRWPLAVRWAAILAMIVLTVCMFDTGVTRAFMYAAF